MPPFEKVFANASLLLSYCKSELTDSQSEELTEWLAEGEENQQLLALLDNDVAMQKQLAFFQAIDSERAFEKVQTIIKEAEPAYETGVGIVSKNGRSLFYKLLVAASIITAIGLGVFFVANKKAAVVIVKNEKTIVADTVIAPGTNKALLVLADGSEIALDDAQNGALAKQGGTTVSKNKGQVQYDKSGQVSSEVLYNTISTPRGGQYQIQLPDGSLVWLNSLSSVRFPTSFNGAEREVEITGQVYFEIVKNTAKPFVVQVNDAQVHVLGTHFDVMAYSDEQTVATTLLEGGIKFVKGDAINVLQPGQQAQLNKEGQISVHSGINLGKVVAWKNGFFDFDGENIETIGKQLSRWYDVEMVYDKKVSEIFKAEIPRNTQFSDVLKALELTGKVHFKIQGRKVIVMP
jgi:transmembrane sensor